MKILIAVTVIIILIIIVYKKRKQNEYDNPKWKAQWEKQLKKEAEEERKKLILSKILVTEEQFNALSEISSKTTKLLNMLCFEERFIKHYNKKENKTIYYNSEDAFLYLQRKFLHDLLWVFDRINCLCQKPNATPDELAECCRINFETIEGHCLLIISNTMTTIDYDSPYTYFDYQRTVGSPESLLYQHRYNDNLHFELFVHYDPVSKQNNYMICELVSDYDPNYEQLYRILMFQIANQVAEIVGKTELDKNLWLIENNEANTAAIEKLEKAVDNYTVPLFKPTTHSNWDYNDDNNTDEPDDVIEITYSIINSDVPEDKFEMEISQTDAEKLKDAEVIGSILDSDYISEHYKSIHKKILRAIRADMEQKAGDPHDGMIQKRHAFGTYWEEGYDSHSTMLLSKDDEIEYLVDVN